MNLPEALQTVVAIETSQGTIDNGGDRILLRERLPQTLYCVLSSSMCFSVLVLKASRMFPFPISHLHEGKRPCWLYGVMHDEAHEFYQRSRRVYSDESVFRKLADYVQKRQHAFGRK